MPIRKPKGWRGQRSRHSEAALKGWWKRKHGFTPKFYKYEMKYFDPADPEGRRMKVWKFMTLREAKAWQRELKFIWKERTARNFPIRKIR